MYIALFDRPDLVSDSELKHDLLSLPVWRKERAMAFRNLTDRVQSAKAFILLRQCLKENYGINDIPPFEYGEYGKPYLPGIHFNLSHCGKGVLCAVDDSPVGCDIETIPNCIDADLMKFCFNEREQKLITAAEHPTVEFARLWTRKEAMLKLTGMGLIEDLPQLLDSTLAEDIILDTVSAIPKGYVYTIAQYANH